MGVYIKVEMPKDCDSCWVSGLRCGLWYDTDVGNRHPDCPLIEVPPHGRLIDADALCERIESERNTEYAMNNRPHVTWKRVLELPLDIISDAPTIIEGEDGT